MIHKAYTLIELLIVISITAIVFGVGIAGYREFSRRQALTGILKQVKADLRLAQQLSLSGQKPSDVTCVKLDSYTFTSSGPGYQIIATCINPATVTSIVKDVTMPQDTTISNGSVKFKILGQGTDLASLLTLTIQNAVSGTSGKILVAVGGAIQ